MPEQPQYATVRRAEAATARSSLDLLGLPYPFSQLGLLTASEFAKLAERRRSRAARGLPAVNKHVLEELHRCRVLVPLFRVDLAPGPEPHKIDVSASLTAQHVRTTIIAELLRAAAEGRASDPATQEFTAWPKDRRRALWPSADSGYLYSHHQLLGLDVAMPFVAKLEERLTGDTPAWHLDEESLPNVPTREALGSWRALAIALSALDTWYWPQITHSLRHSLAVWRTALQAFDPADMLSWLGLALDLIERQATSLRTSASFCDPDRETLSRKFGRLTSVFGNPDRVRAVCRNIVGHYLAGAYRNGLKAQVVAFSRELAVTYTDTINELLAGDEASRVLAEVGRHERITAEVNISVSDAKDEDPAMRPYWMTETQEEEQKRRFLTPDDPLCFLVVTAKLMTGFDAPNEGVLYLDKPMKAHTLFQAITRPNRTWISPAGYTKTTGVVVDYIGLAEEVQRAVTDPTAGEEGDDGEKGGGFVTDLSDLVAEFRAAFARVEDLLAGVDDLDLTVHGYASVRAISAFLDSDPAAAEAFARDYRLLARLYPHISTDPRAAKYRDGFGLFGSVYTTLFKKSSDEERKERLAELGPMVLEIINAHVHSFTAVASQEEPLVLDAQGISILKELLALVRPKASPGDEAKAPPSAAEILDAIKAALDEGVEPGSAKYTALAERLRQLRNRIIQNAQDALDFLAEALKVARTVVDAARNPDQAVVMDEDHVGVLSRIIRDHAPEGLTVTERNLAEEIDQVVTRTLARPWDNADARSRGVRRATAAVFRRYMLKPVGEPYDSTVAYIEAHYLVD